MSVLTETWNRAKSRLPLTPAQTGWIGIDIGTRLTKLVQVERRGQSWALASRWTIGNEDSPPLTRERLLSGAWRGQASGLRGVRRMFRGRLAAATLPSSLAELRSFELPSGPWHETRAMVEEELAAEPLSIPGPLQFDAWETMTAGTMTKVMAVVGEQAAGMRVADDLLTAGVDCTVIDAVPWALARATVMCDPAAATETVAALDLGYETTLLVLIERGRPIFCRTFRGCGFETWMQPLQDQLGISPQECRHLLTNFGVPQADAAESSAAASIHQVIGGKLEHLADELSRTSKFVTHHLRLPPSRVWLYGGGALVRNCANYLTRRAELPVAKWNLSAGSTADQDAPLYGVAAGLSALAWEARACM